MNQIIQPLETAFIYITTGMLSLSTLAACVMGKRSQLPRAALACVAILAAAGLFIIFNR